MVKAQVTDPPPITAGELKPMRLADHDIFSRLCATAVALIIVIALAPLALFRLLISPAIRLPAIRLSKLMKPVDWVWVVLVGVILPIAFFLTINRFTPLGGRGYSVRYLNLLFPTIHFAAILLNLLLAPAMVIRWRLSRRLAPFGIDSPPGKVAVGILGLIVILAMCAFPAVLGTGLGARVILALLFIPALWLCLICFNAYRMLSGRPGERILLTAVSSALFPAYAAAIIALCATVPVFIASERYWAPKDTVIWIDPDAPDLGAYEFKVAAQKRKEINEILGVKID
jgi:hypothetical protein